ncbi:MAG: helix-turn-helix domain-containing protein [Nanoarchaeota archaeon]
MKEEVLAELGLSPNESKVYLSLLETGSTTITKIAEVSGIHRVNVYDSVGRLKDKGLLGEITREGKRYYQAAPPEALKNILREKEIRLNQIMPQLELAGKISNNHQQVEVYEGTDFLRNFFLRCLELKADILSMNIPKFALPQVGKDFQEEFHKRRAKQKQWMYHIYNREATERIKFLNTLPFTKARHLKENVEHTVATTICGNEVAIKLLYENGQKPMIIYIKNDQIAKAYQAQFWLLWEQAKEPGQ